MIFEFCIRKAATFTSLTQWATQDRSSYQLALKKGIHRDVAKYFGWDIGRKVKNKYSYNQCRENARHYKNLKTWKEKSIEYYRIAIRNRWVKLIAKDVGWGNLQKWDFQTCLKIARKYNTVVEWRRANPKCYSAAHYHGWLELIKNDLNWYTGWDYSLCKTKASKFNTLSEWAAGHNASYRYACEVKWQRKIATELGWEVKGDGIRKVRTYEDCKMRAQDCTYLADWCHKDSASFHWAKRRGWHHQIANELGWVIGAKQPKKLENHQNS